MLKGEIDILSGIALKKCKMKQIIGGRAVRDNMYTISTFGSMIDNEFIRERKFGEYRLTPKGIHALPESPKIAEILGDNLHGKLSHQYLESVRRKNRFLDNKCK